MDVVQTKKSHSLPKSIPWEPYKGATSAKHKSSVPTALPPLIPYRISSPSRSKDIKTSELVPSTNKNLSDHNVNKAKGDSVGAIKGSVSNGKYTDDEHKNGVKKFEGDDIVKELRDELLEMSPFFIVLLTSKISRAITEGEILQAERKLSAELKKLLVASMGDDLTCHIQSLSEDKVRLASKMDSFAAQSCIDHDRAEDLQIMSDMWRCKFLAMSVRADELTAQRAHLLDYLRKEHEVLKNLVTVIEQLPLDELHLDILSSAKVLLSVDISQFCERTPCDEKLCRPHPVTSNITISCCKNCAAHEIKLL